MHIIYNINEILRIVSNLIFSSKHFDQNTMINKKNFLSLIIFLTTWPKETIQCLIARFIVFIKFL